MLRTVFHFISEDGYEDYALDADERDQLHAIYQAAGTSFSIETIEEDLDDEPLFLPF